MPHVPGPLSLLAAFTFGGIISQGNWHLNWEYLAGRAVESALEYLQKRPIHIKLGECLVRKRQEIEPLVCETGGGLAWSSVFSLAACSAVAGGVAPAIACRRFETPVETQGAAAAQEPDEEEEEEASRTGPLTRRQRLARHAACSSQGSISKSEGEGQHSGGDRGFAA